MNKFFVWLMVLLFFMVSCRFSINVDITDRQAPDLRQVNLNDFGLNNFTLVEDTSVRNYSVAAGLADKGSSLLALMAPTILVYNSLISQKGNFFAGQTWFWENDSAILYATYESSSSLFCEMFLENDTGRERILWGTYDINIDAGNFYIPTLKDTVLFVWLYAADFNYFIYENLSNQVYFSTKNDFSDYYFEFYFGDTAYVYLKSNHSGRIKYYSFFRDSLWHCWDRDLKNALCEKDVDTR